MLYQAIDSVLLACADADEASAPYRRLGLTVGSVFAGQRSVRVGDFSVYFVSFAGSPLAEPLAVAQARTRGLFALALRVEDLPRTVRLLQAQGIQATATTAMAWLPLEDTAGVDLVLVQANEPVPPPRHRFPLLRLDHLAIIAHNLEKKSRFWETKLGVPVTGEIVTPTMVILQLRIGDAVVELLGPTSADSPIHQRPAGLISMVSWEVASLDEAVRQARATGFTVTDPAVGPLPDTRIATISATELAGVNMQLLQYPREPVST
jgi:catechol 2,3-dioxygenase-like lactoylglutathione lyase family enzyme